MPTPSSANVRGAAEVTSSRSCVSRAVISVVSAATLAFTSIWMRFLIDFFSGTIWNGSVALSDPTRY
jgi:hypothetical protein